MKTNFDESRVFAQSHARVARPEKHGEEWVKAMAARKRDEAKIKSTPGTDKIEGKETEGCKRKGRFVARLPYIISLVDDFESRGRGTVLSTPLE